jgi:hypothetical protein
MDVRFVLIFLLKAFFFVAGACGESAGHPDFKMVVSRLNVANQARRGDEDFIDPVSWQRL